MHMPAEWESHEAVWLGWEDFPPFHLPFSALIKALLPRVNVKIIVSDDRQKEACKTFLQEQGISLEALVFHLMPDNMLWIRDHGATFLRDEQGNRAVADFGWTYYGRSIQLTRNPDNDPDYIAYSQQFMHSRIGEIDRRMGEVEGLEVISTEVNMEGGSIEVNGKGTLILSEPVTMDRNPDLRKSFIESEFRRVLGVRHIIWLPQGLADDIQGVNRIVANYHGSWGTGGHSDEFVRFAGPRTVLLAWEEEQGESAHPIQRLNHARMMENLRVLQTATDQDGKPFRIIKVPLPDLICEEVQVKEEVTDPYDLSYSIRWFNKKQDIQLGDRLKRVAASSYLNYLVTNAAVILPSYVKAGSSYVKEEQVKKIFQEVFPGRELIFLEVLSINYQGGGIHCITQQEPAWSIKKNSE